ncbi:unnamed protein product [Nezara viridula]|uniref:Uncharacterized protein n=1 Tax=Nezara viridula TaxID=85310 RepID=A0A9P0H7D1_NEZVI|nr:unnamed protein product [Nezara viridula]
MEDDRMTKERIGENENGKRKRTRRPWLDDLEDVWQELEHWMETAGIECGCIGSNFTGGRSPLPSVGSPEAESVTEDRRDFITVPTGDLAKRRRQREKAHQLIKTVYLTPAGGKFIAVCSLAGLERETF